MISRLYGANRGMACAATLCCLIGLFASIAFGDTVFMKDGSSLDGEVVQSGNDAVTLRVGSGQMTLQTADVDRIEKNDKKGDAKRLSAVVSKQHQDSLDQRTGLNAEQRDKVRGAIDPLWSPDEAERNTARRKLVAMNKEMPIFQYIESYMPYSKGLIVPELMKALVEIDPGRAKGVLQQYVQNRDPANRAQAIELIGAYKKKDDMELLAQGLVDLDPGVRVAASHAIAGAGETGATPVLLDNLNHPDPRVQNAARAALQSIWNTHGAPSEPKSADEWKAYWARNADSVKDAFDPASLDPLVSKDELAQESPMHDE